MLIGVQSTNNGRYGVVNEESRQLVIPLIYKYISFQKYGIVAECDDNIHSDIYSLDAVKISTAYNNVLLLEDNLLLTCLGDLCMIMNYSDSSFVCEEDADAILFFLGDNPQAHPYTSKTEISDILSEPTYQDSGAYLENRIAIKSSENHLWGVFDRTTCSLHTDFMYPAMVQVKNDMIMVRKDNAPTML